MSFIFHCFIAKKHNFKKHDNSEVDSLGTKYDYSSVMQYSKTAFGINGSVTMDPKDPGVFQLGQRVGFTETDSVQANMLYRCNGMFSFLFLHIALHTTFRSTLYRWGNLCLTFDLYVLLTMLCRCCLLKFPEIKFHFTLTVQYEVKATANHISVLNR